MTPQELKYSILGDAFTGKLRENITSEDFGSIKIAELSEPPFDVPESWVWSTLGLCSEMYTGNSISEAVKSAKYAGLETGYDYIATKDVTFNQEICYDNGVRIPYNEGFKVAHKDAVLMCIEGGSAGRKIGILDRDVCFGNKLCSFHVQGLDNKYLFYYLQSWLFKELFSGNMTGIIGGVSIKKLKEILIPIAPIAEQKRIVARIEELQPLIDRYEHAWSKLEDFNKRFPVDMQKSILQMAIQGKLVPQLPEEGTGEELYQQIQTDKQRLIKAGTIKKEKSLPVITEKEIPFDIPESWTWVRLPAIADMCLGKMLDKQKNTGTPMEYLRNVNVRWGSFDLSDLLEMKFEDIEDERYLIRKNDIVMCEGGEPGRCAVWDEDTAIHFQKALHRIRLSSGLSATFFYHVFCLYSNNGIFSGLFTGTTIKHLTGQSLDKIIVPLPPLAEQKRIVAKLEEILPLCERLK